MKPTMEILSNLSKNSLNNKDEIFTRLYRYLLRPDIYFAAYKNLYANSGAGDGYIEGGIDVDDIPVDFKCAKYKYEGGKIVSNPEYASADIEGKYYDSETGGFDSFFSTNLDDSVRKRYAVWSARVENVLPKCAPEWGMHQYSWKGKVNGIKGDVDMDNCIKDYPTVIKGAGLNGYIKQAADKYKVTAEIGGVTSDKAGYVSTACKNLGMTVTKKKE